MDDWNRWIEAECHRIQGESSHFNFPKIHMLLHFHRQIERFGHLRQWDSNTGELTHKEQIKDGYKHSNKTGDYNLQILNYYLKKDAFAMRELNHNPPRNKPIDEPQGPEMCSPQQVCGKDRIATVGRLLAHVNIDGFDDALRMFANAQHLIPEELESNTPLRELPGALCSGLRIHRQKFIIVEWT